MAEVSQHAFAEKVALVTGGDNAIGRAVAMQLGMYGAYVMVAFQRSGDSGPVIDELKSLGTLAAGIPYDEYGHAGAVEIVKEAEALYQRLDFLVNCTELTGVCAFESTSGEHFSRATKILLESAFFTTQECLRLMSKRPSPRIVNIFSAIAADDLEGDIAAMTLNESIGAFTRGLAASLPAKFQVNAVRVPGNPEAGDSGEDLDPDLFRPKAAVDPDVVGRTVLFLLSSEAKGLRGQVLELGR